MRTTVRIILPFLLIFALLSACTAEKQTDIFILLKRYNSLSESLRADEKSLYLSDDGEKKYSVPITLNGADHGLITAYPDEQGCLRSVCMTVGEDDADITAMQALTCAFTGLEKNEAYEVIKELTEPPVKEKIRYTQTVRYRFAYTVNEPGHYFSIEDKKYISKENDEFTLRRTTSLISSQ